MSMIDKIEKALAEGKLFTRVVRFLDDRTGELGRWMMSKRTPIQKNKIVFMTYDNGYSCNPKYIAEEIIRQDLPWELVWLVPRKGKIRYDLFPENIKLVRRGSVDAFWEIASAKVWIDNAINFFWNPRVPKKPDQVHIDTWHGSMGIKRIGKNDVQNPTWAKAASFCEKGTNFCVSNSTFENGVYKETHFPNTPIWLFGHPRNDCLFNEELIAQTREKIHERFELDKDTRFLLYAPTFRERGIQVYENINFDALAESLSQRFGGEWKILLRLHFHDRNVNFNVKKFGENVLNATKYPDMQELLMAADAGLTDYSSWAYDFILTKRPMFLFAPDKANYDDERGLYFTLESTPFPVAEVSDQLIENVKNFDDTIYQQKVVEFLADKGCAEDGHAAERVVEELKKIIGEA